MNRVEYTDRRNLLTFLRDVRSYGKVKGNISEEWVLAKALNYKPTGLIIRLMEPKQAIFRLCAKIKGKKH